jgi:hypothetical protein
MTQQIKTGHRGFRLFQIAALCVMIFQFRSMGEAQANLVDLYNWIDESTPYKGLIEIGSADSATFIGAYGNLPALNRLNLSGDIDTTPGVTYEISFTLQNWNLYSGDGSATFGSKAKDLDYAFSECDSYFTSGGPVFSPVNYDFTALATSATTTMSFDFILDEGESASLSNFVITEAPEMSVTRLFCYGGCLVLLARQLRRLAQKQKPAVKPIV